MDQQSEYNQPNRQQLYDRTNTQQNSIGNDSMAYAGGNQGNWDQNRYDNEPEELNDQHHADSSNFAGRGTVRR